MIDDSGIRLLGRERAHPALRFATAIATCGDSLLAIRNRGMVGDGSGNTQRTYSAQENGIAFSQSVCRMQTSSRAVDKELACHPRIAHRRPQRLPLDRASPAARCRCAAVGGGAGGLRAQFAWVCFRHCGSTPGRRRAPNGLFSRVPLKTGRGPALCPRPCS